MPRSVQSPGEFLQSMLDKYNLNPFKLSKEIHLSQSAVRLIAIGKTRVSVPVAFRLAKYFKTTPESWLLLQMHYDLAEAAKDKKLAAIVRSISVATKSAATKEAPAKRAKPVKKAAGRKTAGRKAVARKTAVKRGRKPAAAKKAVSRGRPKAGRGRKAR